MKILAIKSSGDRTSISVMLNDEINSFSMDHDRKDRPNWAMLLENIGHNTIFNLDEIDLFAFANNQNSYTATRIVSSYLKGISSALKKPLISIEDGDNGELEIDEIVIIAKGKFLSNEDRDNAFKPKNINPSYNEDIKFKKLDE